jgi:hypothetical protein
MGLLKNAHYFEVIWYTMLFALYETEPINNRLISFCAIETQTKHRKNKESFKFIALDIRGLHPKPEVAFALISKYNFFAYPPTFIAGTYLLD